ncbi:MAG: hypothetical protein RL693_2204 [Verrucomicrobiota bacterium]|jgi:biotin carboxylase
MKRILFIGAAPHQVPAIRHACQAGYEVYTTDNIPENPGHRLAGKSFAVSAADPAAVKDLALSLHVDGVVGYASEICAITAARVAEELGLPGPSYAAVQGLTRKDLFRAFLHREGLQQTTFECFGAGEFGKVKTWVESLERKVVIKPVDSTGSKGVTVAPARDELENAYDYALASSPRQQVLVEEFVARYGSQVAGDGWMEGGRLKFFCSADNQTITGSSHPAIIQETFPGSHPPELLLKLHNKLESILQAAGYHHGPFNMDAIFTECGEPFVFEIAPRNGGNCIPHAILHHTGVDLVAAAVELAVHRNFVLPMTPESGAGKGFHACYMIHSREAGILRELSMSPEVSPFILEINPYLRPGDSVRPFLKAGDAVANVVLGFDSRSRMDAMMSRMPELCKAELTP